MQVDWWKYVVDVAQILSAIGTCGAVIVALWVALRPPQIHLSGSVGMRVVMVEGQPLYVQIQVTNNGEREVFITSLTWVPSNRAELNALQHVGITDRVVRSDTLPKKLAFGESVTVFLPTTGERDWFEGILDNPEVWLRAYSREESLKKLRLYVSTSVGRTHKIKPEPGFLKRMWPYIERAMSQQAEKDNAEAKEGRHTSELRIHKKHACIALKSPSRCVKMRQIRSCPA